MGEERQNQVNIPKSSERDSREQGPRRESAEQAVRQGRTDVVTRRPAKDRESGGSRAPVYNREREEALAAERQGERREASGGTRTAEAASSGGEPSGRQTSAPRLPRRQVVVGLPKSEKPPEKKPPVIVDSPNIDSKRKDSFKRTDRRSDDRNVQRDSTDNDPKSSKDERKFYFQKFGEISTLRRLLMLVFGLLFVWCLAPVFFHIVSIGVISSAAVMLFVFLTAMFWHLIDRNWNVKKAAVCLLAAAIFMAGVTAFGIVSGMMLKASLTAPPSDNGNYTLVVLGCKAHGDQPSWMLHDRLEKAYAVLKDNPGVKCVVTGGQGDDEQFTEAYVMKKYLTKKGISADRIYTEELASSTEENLLYSKAVIRLNGLPETIVIVTDRFHELRARIWAERSGFRNIYAACCETRVYLVTGYWFREMFGLARLYVFGR